MTVEHISRDWSNHAQETIRPMHEYCGVEIFSFDHKYTKTFHSGNYTFKGDNFKKESRRHLNCLCSSDKNSHFSIIIYLFFVSLQKYSRNRRISY